MGRGGFLRQGHLSLSVYSSFEFFGIFFFFLKDLIFNCLFMQVIAVNDKFPGPIVNVTTNWNVVVNVLNSLDEPLLFTW